MPGEAVRINSGVVEAASADAAIKTGIKKSEITDPHEQQRIAAMPEGYRRAED